MVFESNPREACNACLSRASWRLHLARLLAPAPPALARPGTYSGSASPEPPNSLGKSLSFGSPSRMRSTVS
jgi:hypothetical protein